ncbi:hypothetical protein BpHYR1_034766 [Brachionus plicatilis]|uniref:Uncharacterized protein n=1 Tax=Brachionus plicatilis TaxID=10195 RepID=A0A3M7S293_BRAPC|nr:hypothetical protein BpHYR1_034766 [Brachionus plicatilis]
MNFICIDMNFTVFTRTKYLKIIYDRNIDTNNESHAVDPLHLECVTAVWCSNKKIEMNIRVVYISESPKEKSKSGFISKKFFYSWSELGLYLRLWNSSNKLFNLIPGEDSELFKCCGFQIQILIKSIINLNLIDTINSLNFFRLLKT